MLEEAHRLLVHHDIIVSWYDTGLTKLIGRHIINHIGQCVCCAVLNHKVKLCNCK